MKTIEGKSEAVILRALNSDADMIYGIEKNAGKDFMKQRGSGLNQVLCRLASKNQVVIGFDFNDLYAANNRGMILGKMMQNVNLCLKYKVRMYVFDSKCKRLDNDLKAFAFIIGMNTSAVKKCLKFGKKEKDVEVL